MIGSLFEGTSSKRQLEMYARSKFVCTLADDKWEIREINGKYFVWEIPTEKEFGSVIVIFTLDEIDNLKKYQGIIVPEDVTKYDIKRSRIEEDCD